MEYKQYKRTNIAEMREWKEGDNMEGVSISQADLDNGSPRQGDRIARNPKDHKDMWLVAEVYFEENFEEIDPSIEESNKSLKLGDLL